MVKHGAHLWQKHPAVRSGNQLSAGERAADVLKHWFLGTWTALFGVGFAIAVWVVLQKTSLHWDFYPFILLNLCLSCLAAVQGIILQISANRGDRISAEVALHTSGNTDELMRLNRAQLEILTRLDSLNGQVSDLAGVVQQVMAQRAEHDKTVAADAKRAATAAESAFVATQVLASQATGPQPAVPEPAHPAVPPGKAGRM